MKFFLICLALVFSASAQFSTRGARAMLNSHNRFRTYPKSPGPTAMLKLEYNYDLEDSAQAHADKCPEPSADDSGAVGMNIYFGTGSADELDAAGSHAMTKWTSEAFKGYRTLTFTEENRRRGVGEVAQLDWAKTQSVGCGVKACASSKVVVVCHYNPPGKVIGEEIYVEGETGSECPSGTTHEVSTGLCVKD